ncbi:MAG: MraY family glycosyltransferase [Anaerolineales bacterium]|nr:MraY family glycosyltransferase [Anaerolineales bacterium]
MNTYATFRVIFVSGITALALGPLLTWLSRRAGLIDVPGSAPHKLHRGRVPIAGGMVIYLTVILVGFWEGEFQQPGVLPLLVSPAVIFLFGLLDDWKNLAPQWKFAGQLIGAAVLIACGIQVRLFHQMWLNVLLTLIWMIGVTNAYNFVDSMDGLATGLGGMAAAFFMLVTIESRQGELTLFSTILLGACLGAFYFNASPAIFFLGDSGSQLLGFMLGALAIAYTPIGYSPYASWYVPILLAGVPIFDATLVIFSRLRRGRPVYQAGRDHTYHRLVALGMSPNRAVLTMHIAAMLLGSLAFIALGLRPLLANTIFVAVVLLGIVVLLLLDRVPFEPDSPHL